MEEEERDETEGLEGDWDETLLDGLEGLERSSSFDSYELDVLLHMDDPPHESYETSWLRAREILETAGPGAAILLLTVTHEGEDLASSVVVSSGYQEIPVGYILEILQTHLGAL